MQRARLTDTAGQKSSSRTSLDGVTGNDLRMLLTALRSGAPGQWSQNLLELSRHFTSAAYLAINTMSVQGSASTFEAYERTHTSASPNGKRALGWDDPIHQLFEDPNEQDTWQDLLYQTIQQKCITGLVLTWAPKFRDGDISEIYPIPSATAWPMPPTYDMPHGSYRIIPYVFGQYGPSAGQINAGAVVPAEQLIRVKNHHPLLRWEGYATLTACSLQVDTLEAIDKGRHNTQQLGCDQSIAIELDGETLLPDDAELARIRSQLQALYAGPMNAGKLMIPPPGAKINKYSTSPSEMAYQEGWAQVLDFVLASFGVPKAVAGLQDSMSYATLFSSLKAFSYLSLGPNLSQINHGWNKKLVRPTWGNKYGITIFPPVFKDEALEELKFANDIKVGTVRKRERRKYLGLDVTDEAWMDELCTMTHLTGEATGEGSGGNDRGPKRDGQEEDPDVNNGRPRKTDYGMRDDLLRAIEHGKTNGSLMPVKR